MSTMRTSAVLRRVIIVSVGFALQIGLSMFVYIYLGEHLGLVELIYLLLGLVIVLTLVMHNRNYSYTLPWIVIILLYPVVGTLIYVIIGTSKRSSRTMRAIEKSEQEHQRYLRNSVAQDEAAKPLPRLKKSTTMRYLEDYAGFPATTGNQVDYYGLGDEALPAMLHELSKAKKFIFMEYFIIAQGQMWDSILQVLEQKAASGVEVRVMYDDMGCVGTLPEDYAAELEQKGIKCEVFNRLNPVAGVIMNNRDHRKITVIDGKVAFSGGINLADEYINAVERFGHWKDNAIKVSGPAVWNYTVMFLTMWNAMRPEDADLTKYQAHPHKANVTAQKSASGGYVIPYADSPLDKEITGEDVCLNIINQAQDYVYMMTPYLIIDTDMVNALILAAKRGVDVRIVIPGIPDKKIVYTVSESYMTPLVQAGVKVYRYTPGFVHAKVFVADDAVATVGTINMDYRSLYLHFECGCYLERSPAVQQVKADVLDTIDKSHLITKDESRPSIFKETWQALLRIFAPLM